MHELRFLCLAVSRRDGGNCIAGIDLDSGKWIRPVNARTDGALGDHEIIVKDAETQKHRIMEPLDVLQLRVDKYVGDNAQPENWEVAPASYKDAYLVLRRFERQEDKEKLISYLDQKAHLLHSDSESVPDSEVRSRTLTHSLSLIRPERLYWKVRGSKYSKRLQVRAVFLSRQIKYDLVLTDPIWETKCTRFDQGRLGSYPHSLIAGEKSAEVLLTISLAGVPLNGFHYKLAAAVIDLPAQTRF
ncbi:MAG: dual OB domain-containing protein [Terracidiphilus sp.]